MSSSSHTCAVTIAGPEKRVDVVVPSRTPIAELISTFVELSVDGHDPEGRQPVWAIAPPGQDPLPLDRTLTECGVSDGAVLTLTEIRPAHQAPPAPREVHRPELRRGTPRERTAAALPDHLDGGARVSAAIRAFFGHEDEPFVVDSTAAAPPSTREVLTRKEERTARERARASWRDTEYLARLSRAAAAPRLHRCATIAVLSPKGGVGKTTLTALLGSKLAQTRRDRIVAVDTNPDYGSLGRTLTPEHGTYVDDLLDVLERPNLSVTELDGHLGRAFEGLMVLPAPTDPQRMAKLDENAYRTVIGRLQELVGVLVLDCGTGLSESAARAAQACADQIVLISDAHPATASLVVEAAAQLQTVGPPLTVVVNKLPESAKDAQIDLAGLEELIPDAAGLLTITADQEGATRVAAGDFAWRDAPASWSRAVGELAVVLTADWSRLGLAS